MSAARDRATSDAWASTPKVTFFMIVTDRDAPIADYAVRSYRKIRGIRFRLHVYANWLTPATKDRYLSSWRELDFVDIHENPSGTGEERPDPRVQRGLAGPFEKAYSIWDRELAKITTPLHATVDADLEIFDDRFVHDMVGRLEGDDKLVAVSLEYMPTVPEYYDSYSDEVIYLNGGGLNCFFLYKRAALDCDVSYQYHEEIIEGPVRRVAWDEGVWRQEALKREGYEVGFLGPGYERCYVHYKSFSNNVDIDARNVALFRRLSILRKMGVLGRGQRVTKLPYDLLFRSARRDIYHVD